MTKELFFYYLFGVEKMILYKLAKTVHIGQGYVIVEKNQEGFLLQVPDTQRLKIDEFRKFYIYKHITDFKRNSYGFLSFKEWITFQDLLKLAGIGPKLAFHLLEQGHEYVIDKITTGNYQALAQIPYISEKNAKQIIFQLSDKYKHLNGSNMQPNNEADSRVNVTNFQRELKLNLKKLGFKPLMIEKALEKNQETTNLDQAIQNCIQITSHDFSAALQDSN